MPEIGYKSIADDYRNAITRGDYPPGSLLPHQENIAETYSVNRNTVRRAMIRLSYEGYVNLIPGKGTEVREQNPLRLPIQRYTQSRPGAGPWETACANLGIKGYTAVTGVSWVESDAGIAADLEIEPGSLVIHRANEMNADGVVLQLQDTWIPEDIARGTPLAEPAKISGQTYGGIYGGLAAAGHRPVSVVETVTARMPTQVERVVLGLGLGSPVLDSRRVTRDAEGRVVVVTRQVLSGLHACLTYPQEL